MQGASQAGALLHPYDDQENAVDGDSALGYAMAAAGVALDHCGEEVGAAATEEELLAEVTTATALSFPFCLSVFCFSLFLLLSGARSHSFR